jgi:hypothetical protein
MRNVPISFPAAARRKPTGLNVCRNGCAERHRGGPYWLPPRRAPFGRRAGQPSEGAPTDTARSPRARQRRRSPFTAAGRRVASFEGLSQNQNPQILRSIPLRGDMPRWLQVGTELRIVAAEACGVVFGPTGTGPRRVVRLPTADSLCDRMERGEEEASTGRRDAFPITILQT